VFRGKFETADSIRGEVEFSPLLGDLPSKHARSAARLGIVASSRSRGGNMDRTATAGRCRRRSGRYQTQSRISNALTITRSTRTCFAERDRKVTALLTKRKQASSWRRAIASLLVTNLICYREISRSQGNSAKKIKKACHSCVHPVNPGAITP
jgi:hypothetical protein